MIQLDGSTGEGGGQILRTALLLSLLTDQPFRIEKIRLGRSQPGLKPQHAHILHALHQMSTAQVDTMQPGATELTFYPGTLRGGYFALDIGTAGAIPLFLQTILPVAMFAPEPVTVTVTGGTDVRGAPSSDFCQHVLLPFLQPYADQITFTIAQRGFYPKGGGRIELRVVPRFTQTNWPTLRTQAPALQIDDRGALQRIRILSCASQALRERRVATRQAAACQNAIRQQPQHTAVSHVPTRSPGSVITVVAEYEQTRLGVDQLGERGLSSEQVGQAAAHALQQEIAAGGTVDVHTADNLMVWVALFGGGYSFAETTGHIATNAWVIEQFLPGSLQLTANRVQALR